MVKRTTYECDACGKGCKENRVQRVVQALGGHWRLDLRFVPVAPDGEDSALPQLCRRCEEKLWQELGLEEG